MTAKIFLGCVSEKTIDDSNFLVYLSDIFGLSVMRNSDINIAIGDEFTFFVEFEYLHVDVVHQIFLNAEGDNQEDEDRDYDGH
jgi:hypothetical protein